MSNRRIHVGKTPAEKDAYAKLLRTPISAETTYEDEATETTDSVTHQETRSSSNPQGQPYIKRVKRIEPSRLQGNWVNLIICIIATIICAFIIGINRDVGIVDNKVSTLSNDVRSTQNSINSIGKDVQAVNTKLDVLVNNKTSR